MTRKTVVTLCAGSSGNHVLAADLGHRGTFEIRLVTSRPRAWSSQIECEEIRVLSDALPLFSPTWRKRYVGIIDAIHPWTEIETACDGADLVILTGPVHSHRAMLERVVPALARAKPTIVGTLFAQGGVDWIYRDVCRQHQLPADRHTLFGLKRFPYLCTTREYGRSARLMGRFPKIVAAISGHHPTRRTRARTLLRELFGKPVVELPSFLGCTLNLSNQILHPAISAPLLRGRASGPPTLPGPVALYGSCYAPGAANMCGLANEFRAVGEALESLVGTSITRYLGADPGVRLYLVTRQLVGRHLEGDRRYEALRDHFIAFCIRHNRRLEQAKLPLLRAASGEGFVPDFGSRFWKDDIPHGLCVVFGLGALLGIPMPRARAMILEHQAYMGKQYLLDDPEDPTDPFGRDRNETNAPQRYGVCDREALRIFLREYGM